MERRSWPWRKKVSPKLKRASFDSHRDLVMPATSYKATYEEPTASRIDVEQDETPARIRIENAVVEAVSQRQQAEDKAKSLTEKLSVALEDMTAQEALVKQHSKVAQEAVSGWEKAEAEAVSLKRELESSAQQRTMAEDRVAHMDGALRECMKQVRQAREEQEQKIQEAILQKTREWDQIKAELDAKQAELGRRLMESSAENSAMTKSLQERATMLVELKEAKAKAETEAKVLQVKVQSLEKEVSSQKYEMHVLNKELEIRNQEREYSKKSADAAHKQHLENVKKIAQLESECQRLRNLVRKKLPGPAALAQMRMEVDGPRRDVVGDGKRRSRSLSKGPAAPSPAASNSKQEIEMLIARMQSMEQETKLLKEALAHRNGELQSSRQLCARTVGKLSVAEDQLESLQGTPRSRISGVDLQPETSVASRSEDCNGGTDDQEVNCAESWASALIGELAHIKKDKASHASRLSMESCNFDAAIEEFLEAERKASDVSQPPANSVVDKAKSTATECKSSATESCVANQGNNATGNRQPEVIKSTAEDRRTLKIVASKEAELQAANLMCKDACLKLSTVQEQLGGLKCEGDGDEKVVPISKAGVQESLKGVMDEMRKLDKVLDEMRIAVASMDDSETEENVPAMDAVAKPKVQVESSMEVPEAVTAVPPAASFRFVLCKLVLLLDMLRVLAKTPTDSQVAQGPSLEKLSADDRQMQALLRAKENLLDGKGDVLVFLLRLAVVMSGLCRADTSELERELSKSQAETDTDSAIGVGSSVNEEEEFRKIIEERKAELEKELGVKDEELQTTKLELQNTKALVTDLQTRVSDLQNGETKAAAEAEKAGVEIRKLQASVASLTVDLADQRKLYDEALATCQNLEHKLSLHSHVADTPDPRKLTDDDVVRCRKERDVAAAKEKLAECQRSIQVLEKQLTALSSPPAHSRVVSFDSTSLDLDHFTPPEDCLHRRRNSQNRDTPPSVNGSRFSVVSMYDNSPPYNTIGSPDASPPNTTSGHNNKSVRTSLASSINLAASVPSPPTYPKPATKHHPKPGSASNFSRFFSKSKYHR